MDHSTLDQPTLDHVDAVEPVALTLEEVEDAIALMLPERPTKAQILAFAQMALAIEAEEGITDIDTTSYWAPGLYARSVLIRKDTILVGLPHKEGCLNICLGDITVWSEGKRDRLTGFHVLSSDPDMMRIGRGHTDTTWLTVHANPTNTRDMAVIESMLTAHADLLMDSRLDALDLSVVERFA
jgi:hypothetical protein